MITTACIDQTVTIAIADNGTGISPEHQAKIFDAFFTTKAIGVGTGLGLSISWEIITTKHGGQLACSSVLGQGTTFMITLPIHQTTTPEAGTAPQTVIDDHAAAEKIPVGQG